MVIEPHISNQSICQTLSQFLRLPRLFACLFVWFLNVLVKNQAISRTGPKTERLTILRAATHETELGDHGFCLSRSHFTDTDPTSRERAATAGIEPGTSSPGVARSTDSATEPPPPPPPASPPNNLSI